MEFADFVSGSLFFMLSSAVVMEADVEVFKVRTCFLSRLHNVSELNPCFVCFYGPGEHVRACVYHRISVSSGLY